MMSAKRSDFLTPSPLSAFESDLCYKIHATSLTTFAFPCGHHIWKLPCLAAMQHAAVAQEWYFKVSELNC